MNFETVVQDVKDRLDTVGTQAQDVAKRGVETLKTTGEIVVTSVQGLVKTNASYAKTLADAGKASFEKASKDGLVAVVKHPAEYLPAGRETLVGAFNDTVEQLGKTSEQLVKTLKAGVEDITVVINGKSSPAKRAAKTVKSTAKRAQTTAKAAKKKATTAARKTTAKAQEAVAGA